MKTNPCPVCGDELQIAVHFHGGCTVWCTCCPQMNDGVAAIDLPRALFALNAIADAMDPDKREEIKLEQLRFHYAAKRRVLNEDDPRLEER